MMTPYGTWLRANVNLGFMVFFLMSFLLVLLRSRFDSAERYAAGIDGVVLSMRPDRFNHAQHVLTQLGLRVVQREPPSFQSVEVNRSLEAFIGSRDQHSPTSLKAWSNQMAFEGALEEFAVEEARSKRWRFFLEDDVALHPDVTYEHTKVLIAKGLGIADGDGFVYLGICGPSCEGSRVLEGQVEAARCAGPCSHAFGFQAWAAAQFLEYVRSSETRNIYMDQNLLNYGRQVKKAWVLGSNLKSPVAGDHVGLLYQDRLTFPTTMG
jgi:hypothetical protein